VRHVIRFAASVKRQLQDLTARERVLLLEAIEEQLSHEPLKETRKRKPLRPNPLAPWELRVGELRVFYDVEAGSPGTVTVVAVGRKRGNVLYIAGEEVEL
jgi:mRNA-degrading endonuclease RelE of RelBE toxin-antitoxin system